jgi:glycolate dehydrogenase FAD-binding subunit
VSETLTQIAWPALAEIVGKEYLRPATDADAIDGVAPQMVAEPATAEVLARTLRWANDVGVKVSPRGGGTKLGWGNPPAGCDLVVSTARLNRVLEHAWADMTVIVEAGSRVADLQKTLAEHRQQLAIDPLWPERATIGGILSANDSGALRARYGSLRDLIIGITVALPDGTLAKSGGKVVKNVAGYDLMKLFTGALGTLGVIVQAIFRLHPLPRESRSLSFNGAPESMNQLMLAIMASKLAFAGLQLRAQPGNAQLDVRCEGTAAGCEAQLRQIREIAGSSVASEAPANVWRSHEAVWENASAALLAKFSVLPTQLAAVCALVEQAAAPRSLNWKTVAQSVGAGYVRLDGAEQDLRIAWMNLRDELAKMGGTLVVLGCPLQLKRGFDVWGPTSDAQPVMVRIKQRFDPDGTLNPGRFVGGI